MSSFRKTMSSYIKPYSGHVVLSVVTNVLAALLNLVAFSVLIPILKILFGMESGATELIDLSTISLRSIEGWNEWGIALQNNLNYYVTSLISSLGATRALLVFCLYLGIMTLIKVLVTYSSLWCLVPVRTGVVRDLRNKLNKAILNLPLGYMSEEHKGDILARISVDVAEVEGSIVDMLEVLIKNPILIFIYMIALFFISWQLTLFVIVVLPIAGGLMGIVGKRLKRDSAEGKSLWGVLMSYVEETLGGLRVIKAFNAQKQMHKRFVDSNEEYRHIISRMYARQQLAHPMSEFLGTVTIAIILYFGGTLILGGDSAISAPLFIYYLVIFYSVLNPAKELTRSAFAVQRGLASMERIEAILDADNPIKDPENPQPISFEHEMRFDAVTFGYISDKPVLKELSLTIPKGKTVALVGLSGSGKSTMADLLPRFFDPDQGAVRIDGVDIREFRVTDLRSLIGYVNQEAILFNDTVAANISLSKPNATEEEIRAAAIDAYAHDFIMQMPLGYESNVGDRGSKLSGGERQRISIARALLKNPPILILDEATSALDAESELAVQSALNHLLKDRTTLVIAHRLSTIEHADTIAVLDDGRIIEQGTHAELLALGGRYAQFRAMQQGNDAIS